MSKLVLVCGPVGAGKTSYSLSLCEQINGVRFSIDPWMQTLFAKDMVSLDYGWLMDRVGRCHEQIWQVSEQILSTGGNVVLDLGFQFKADREAFYKKGQSIGKSVELHYLTASEFTRKERVKKRNKERDPLVFTFVVTDEMFAFMEPRFEFPNEEELKNGYTIEQ